MTEETDSATTANVRNKIQTDSFVCLLDEKGYIIDSAGTEQNPFGLIIKDMVQQPFTVILPPVPSTISIEERYLDKALQNGYYTEDIWVQQADGSRLPVEMVITSLPQVYEGARYQLLIRPKDGKKNTDDELLQNEERFRMLVQGVRDYAIFMLNPKGYIMSWNEGAQRIKGYMPEEIIGQHFSIFYPKEDLERGKLAYELRIATEEGRFEDEDWRIRKNGTRFWANVIITALRNEHNELIGFSKITRDLTERKSAEEALRQSEVRNRLLIEGVKDYAIFMLDPNGYISSWNEGAQRIKGYTANEIIGKHFSVFYPAYDRENGKPALELKIATEEGRFEDEDWRIRKDGTRFWASVIITALHDEQGKLMGFSKITRDLTERRNAEDELRKSADRFRSLGESIPQMMWTAEPDGRINYMNRKWTEYTGFAFDPERADDWSKVVHPDDLLGMQELWQQAFHEGEEFKMELRIHYCDNTYHWFLSRALPIFNTAGAIDQWVGTFTDIQDQKESSEQLKEMTETLAKTIEELKKSVQSLNAEVDRRQDIEAELMEKNRQLLISNTDLEQFAYVASHDLKEPLRMISSYTELLIRRMTAPDPELHEYAGFITDGVRRMQALINDLLAYSRVGRSDIYIGRVNTDMVLDKAIGALTQPIEQSGAHVTHAKMPIVEGVFSLLENLFKNLIGNAIKFRKPNVPPEIFINVAETDKEWIFSVQDNGIGIASEYRDKIFVIFQRLHTRDEYEGTGIGLAICKKIAEFHGGRMWVESEPGQGSTFYFSLRKRLTKPQ